MNQFLNRQSSQQSKKDASTVVFNELADYLFEEVNLINQPGIVTSNGVISTTVYNVAVRVPDTSGGKYIRPDRRSRLRTIFYIFGGAEKADAYILSPCFYPSSTSISAGITSLSIFNYYIGIKIYKGEISLVAKDPAGERIIPAGITISGATTNKLEVLYNITHADIYINDNFVGSISIDTSLAVNNLVTAYPVIAPIKSTDGTSVEMDLENYQFLQDK